MPSISFYFVAVILSLSISYLFLALYVEDSKKHTTPRRPRVLMYHVWCKALSLHTTYDCMHFTVTWTKSAA